MMDLDKKKVDAAPFETQYYNANIHWGAFQLPSFMANNYKKWLTPLPEVQFKKP
jgi:spermidine synthase